MPRPQMPAGDKRQPLDARYPSAEAYVQAVEQAAMKLAEDLEAAWPDERGRELYAVLKDNPVIRWKDSIRRVVGMTEYEGEG